MPPRKGLLLWGIVLLLALAMALGCSDDDEDTPTNGGTNPPTTTTIGPLGGVLQVAGQVVLTIAPGALADTVEFSVKQNLSPAALPDGFFASNVYTIGPSGTQFTIPAPLSLTFSETMLGKPFDTSLQIFTNSGSGWDPLTTVLDSAGHLAVTTISHLSDFAVRADTGSGSVTPPEGFSAALVVGRMIMWQEGMQEPMKMDQILARFDSSLTPCTIVNPQQADTVYCNQYGLVWWPDVSAHTYDFSNNGGTMEFLGLGTEYVFTVVGNAAVPSLVDTITFPSLEPYLTYPPDGETVSRYSDLVLTWAGSGAGSVGIAMGPMNNDGQVTDTSLFIEVPNNGTYTITSTQMGIFGTGDHGIVLIHQNRDAITTPGYNSENSFISGRIISATGVMLQ